MAWAVETEEVSPSQGEVGSIEEAKSLVKQVTDLVSEEVRLQLRNLFEQQKGYASGKLDALTGAFHQAANQLTNEHHDSFARYATAAASRVEGLSGMLKEKRFEEFTDDARRLLRSKPVMVLGGSILAGYVLARIVKRASSEESQLKYRRQYQGMPPLH